MGKEKNAVLELSTNIMVIEEIADAVIDIASAFKKMKTGRLKEDAIIALIANNCRLGKKDIKSVLDAAANLDVYINIKK